MGLGYLRFIDNGVIKDTRRAVSYLKQTVTGPDPATGQPVVYTFPRTLFIRYVSDITKPYTQRSADPVNFPLVRYSEVLPIPAEALNEENSGPAPEACEAINRVRRRTFGELPCTQPSSRLGADPAARNSGKQYRTGASLSLCRKANAGSTLSAGASRWKK